MTDGETLPMTMTIQRRDTIRSDSGILFEVPGAVSGAVRKQDGQRTPFDSHRTGRMRIRRCRERFNRLNRFKRVGRLGRFVRSDRCGTDKTGDRCQTDTAVVRSKTDKIETMSLGIWNESVVAVGGLA